MSNESDKKPPTPGETAEDRLQAGLLGIMAEWDEADRAARKRADDKYWASKDPAPKDPEEQ